MGEVSFEKITLKQGKDIDDMLAFVIATDNCDSNVNVVYSWDKEFNKDELGTYIVTYKAIDESGNESNVIYLTIEVVANDRVLVYVYIGIVCAVVVLISVLSIMFEIKKERNKSI